MAKIRMLSCSITTNHNPDLNPNLILMPFPYNYKKTVQYYCEIKTNPTVTLALVIFFFLTNIAPTSTR